MFIFLFPVYPPEVQGEPPDSLQVHSNDIRALLNAWIARERISHLIPFENPQKREPSVKMPNPILNTRLRPKISSSLPSWVVQTATTRDI